jgi:hypothetical protein
MTTFTPDLDPAVLDRLREYAARFAPGFPPSKPARWAGVYLQGLLLDGERKSVEPLARRVTLPAGLASKDLEQALQPFVNQSPWDDRAVAVRYRRLMAERFAAHEKDPTDKAGLYGTGKSLKQELAAETWDVITIQQASIRSHDVGTYRPGMKELSAFIKKHAPASEVVVHQTWAYRVDDPRFGGKAEPKTQMAMYDGLSDAYRTIAREFGVRYIPVGDAFSAADTDPKWGYRPDRSLTRGRRRTRRCPTRSTRSMSAGGGRTTRRL